MPVDFLQRLTLAKLVVEPDVPPTDVVPSALAGGFLLSAFLPLVFQFPTIGFLLPSTARIGICGSSAFSKIEARGRMTPCRLFSPYLRAWCLLALALLLFPLTASAADSWQGKAVRVVDGATLDIARQDGQVERIKLYAIVVPSPVVPAGDAAKERTRSWSHQWGDVAEVLPMGLAPSGEVIARVIVGREDLANVLAKACLAIVDMQLCRECNTPECVGWQAWELQCRDENKGWWGK